MYGPGSVVPPFLFSNPKTIQVAYVFYLFSLPARNVRRGPPLHQLLHKLTRSGQHKAVAALRGLSAPLPPDVRIRWRIYGTSLSVEVAS